MQALSGCGAAAGAQSARLMAHSQRSETDTRSTARSIRQSARSATPDQLKRTCTAPVLQPTPQDCDTTPAAQQSRRDFALGGLSLASLCFLPVQPARATLLRSQRSDRPCALTIQNNGLHSIKLFWINYDGMPGLQAQIKRQHTSCIRCIASEPDHGCTNWTTAYHIRRIILPIISFAALSVTRRFR